MIEITIERYNELIRAELGCKVLCDIISNDDDTYKKLDHLKIIQDTIRSRGDTCCALGLSGTKGE